jgi:hypothetical protein
MPATVQIGVDDADLRAYEGSRCHRLIWPTIDYQLVSVCTRMGGQTTQS